MASSSSCINTDWSNCFICQNGTSEKLITPRCGYKTLSNNIPIFQSISALPLYLNPQRLDDGSGIEQTLIDNNAKYHDSCRLLFKDSKLAKAQKRYDNQKRKANSSLLEDDDRPRIKRKTFDMDGVMCFICDQYDNRNLCQVESLDACNNLREMSKELCDSKLLKSVSGPDAIAQELKYHPACLTGVRNRVRSLRRARLHESNEENIHDNHFSVAFSELVTYIYEQTFLSDSLVRPSVFQLCELKNIYCQRLIQMGVEEPNVNETRLKEQLLHHIPELESYKKGRNIVLAFKADVGPIMSKATQDEDAIIVSKAAQILRKQMLVQSSTFQGNFDEDYVQNCVPQQLTEFVVSMCQGADLRSRGKASKTELALSHLLLFNCHKTYKETATFHRHSSSRETAFPVYLGLNIYSKTRKENLVNILYDHGLSISYDRVLEISNAIGESVVSRYVENEVICPMKMKKGVFTTSAVDNIDHNPSSSTSSSSFHGTSISLFQHAPSSGISQDKIEIINTHKRTISKLPDSYTNVKPAN